MRVSVLHGETQQWNKADDGKHSASRQPDNQADAKHVESASFPCLDVGSNPTGSTLLKKTHLPVAFHKMLF